MENNPPSLLRAHDLLREIRQAIRKVEVAVVPSNPTTKGSEDSVVWTTSSIEVCGIGSSLAYSLGVGIGTV